MKKSYFYPIFNVYYHLKPDNEIKKFILNSKRLLLFLLIIANTFFTQAQSVQLTAAIPIDSRGVWDRGDQFIADPNNPIYDFVKGIRAEFFWRDIEPSSGVYDWSAVDAEIQIAAAHNKLVYINLLVGPDCPAWVYANGVPKVLANTTQFNGEFPYYLDADYKFYYYRIIAQFGQHIRTLPQSLREKITFLQIMTGCTGDEVPYKGTLKSASQSYAISDADWLTFRIDAFKEYKKAFYDGDVNTRVPMLFNNVTPDEGSYLDAWNWIIANIGTGFGIKGSAYARGHHLDSELDFKNTWYDKLVNPQSLALFSRCEMDQSFTKPLYQINVPLGFYWGMLSGLNTGLSVWDLSAGATQAAISDPAIMESITFFNKYASQIYPSTATSAYCVFHEGLNSANATKFPSATYGSPVNHGNESRYLAICNATKYSSRGAKMDDSFAATLGQVYQRDSQTGYNDSGWQIEEGNYQRWITQIDPENTSIGLFRVRGTIGTSSSKYDRFARSFESSTGKNTMYFQLHNEFVANNKILKFTVRWLDKTAGSTWAFKYRNASGLQTINFTGAGGNQWKVETITVTDAIMNQGGNLGSDFLLVNTDAIDDVFSSVEMDVIGSTSIKQDQTINFNVLPSKTFGDADFAPGATASSGLAVSYASSNTAVATILNGLIHIVGAGTSTITASQAGDSNYNAAPSVSQGLTVSKSNQTITFNALPSKTIGAADFNPGATASSGLAVSYASSNTAVATIVSGLIHIVGAGTSTIMASQVGDSNYNAATSVSQTLTVTGPVVTTYNPTSFTVLLGTKNSGTINRLATNDANVMVFSSSTSSTRSSDWYSSTVISQAPSSVTKLTINYDGKNSISRTQLLYLYNWSTSSWTQIDSRTVSTTDVLITNIQNSPVNFISPTGEIRLRVYSSGGNKNYTCSADWVSITVENSSGLRLKPETAKTVSPNDTKKFKVFPNPASGSSTFEYSIPEEGKVQLNVYNFNGQMIKTIVNDETHLPGNYTKAFDASGLGNGVYVAQLKFGNQVQTIKVIVKN